MFQGGNERRQADKVAIPVARESHSAAIALGDAEAPAETAPAISEEPSAPGAAGSASAASVVPAPATVLGMAASFAASMARFAASGFKRLDEQSHRLRVGQCEPCRYRQRSRCTLCGCFFDKKAWLPHEDCPVGRWPM